MLVLPPPEQEKTSPRETVPVPTTTPAPSATNAFIAANDGTNADANADAAMVPNATVFASMGAPVNKRTRPLRRNSRPSRRPHPAAAPAFKRATAAPSEGAAAAPKPYEFNDHLID